MTEPATGVLLINTGSPAAPEPEAVKAYLSDFLMDKKIRPLPAVPWWVILHAFILPRRKKASAEKYRMIWTRDGSPLLAHMERLTKQVGERLADGADGVDGAAEGVGAGGACEAPGGFGDLVGRGGAGAPSMPGGPAALDEASPASTPVVHAAMLYGDPSIATQLSALRDAGCARVVALPLYPQSAFCTTGAARAGVLRALKHLGWHPALEVVDHYADDDAYLDAIAASVHAAGFDPAHDQLVFSLHSAPVPDVRAGDTYPRQVEMTARLVAERLGAPATACRVSYQSPFEDQRTWLSPFTVELVRELAPQVTGRLFLVCPGFACDCLETLYDVEAEIKPAFLTARTAAGLDAESGRFVYVPCLNESAAHADLLSRIVARAATRGFREA